MRRQPRQATPDKVLKLACGHEVSTNAPLQLEHPEDYYMIPCPPCRQDPMVPLSWQEITGAKEIIDLYDVSSRIPQVLRTEIMRMQPGVPFAERNLFPYRKY